MAKKRSNLQIPIFGANKENYNQNYLRKEFETQRCPSKLSESQTKQFVHSLCSNGDGRRTTHYIIRKNQKSEYCPKCAIMLASQGAKIFKIDPHIKKRSISVHSQNKKSIQLNATTRLSQVHNLLNKINHYNRQITKLDCIVHYQLADSQKKFNTLLSAAGNFYKEIEQMIEFQKYLTYNRILNVRVGCQTKLREKAAGFGQLLSMLRSMQRDLVENQQIVKMVSQEQYQKIMDGYVEKITQLPQVINEQLQKIQIPEINFQQSQFFQILSSLNNRIEIEIRKSQINQGQNSCVMTSQHKNFEKSRFNKENKKYLIPRYDKDSINFFKKTMDSKEVIFSFEDNQQPQMVGISYLAQSSINNDPQSQYQEFSLFKSSQQLAAKLNKQKEQARKEKEILLKSNFSLNSIHQSSQKSGIITESNKKQDLKDTIRNNGMLSTSQQLDSYFMKDAEQQQSFYENFSQDEGKSVIINC